MRHVFVDESSQNAHHYMVLGALNVPGDGVAAMEAELAGLVRAERLGASEMKWTEVNKRRLPACRAMVDHYFDSLVDRGGQFSAVVVDCWGLNHRKFNAGDKDLGYNKFLSSLLQHKVGSRFGERERIVVDLDARTTARSPEELQAWLNYKMSRMLPSTPGPVFSRVAFRDSEDSRLLQLADVLAGAIAWHKNDHDARECASPWKVELANHVAARIGRRRLGACSPRAELRLNVWNHALQT